MRRTGRIFWLLAFSPKPFGLTFFPPSPIAVAIDWLVGNRIQLQQRNCSGFTPDFSRRSTVSNSQRTKASNSGLRFPVQDLFSQARFPRAFLQCQQLKQN
jgi:hypothetical protein